MNDHQIIGIAAAVIGISASLPYFISIIRRQTILNRASWFVWLTVGGVSFSSYAVSGAKATIFLPAIYLFTNALFFGMSLIYGEGGFNTFDIACVMIAILALVIWVLTKRSDYANYITLFADSVGFLPTYKKIWRRPETENLMAWLIVTFAEFLNLLAIDQKRLVIIANPVVIFVEYFLVVLLLLRRTGPTAKKIANTINPFDPLV